MGIFYNSIDSISIAILIVIIIVFLGWLLSSVLSRYMEFIAKKTKNNIDNLFVAIIKSFGIKFYLFFGIFFVLKFYLYFPEGISHWITQFFILFIAFQIYVVICRSVNFLIKVYSESYSKERGIMSTILPALGSILKFISFIVILIFVLSNLNVNVTALLAGFGIVGLTIAFAFRSIVADLFSSFVIFIDRPFSTGDHVVTERYDGHVEKVGLKTTRIRSIHGDLITVPNHDLVDNVVHNVTDKPTRRAEMFIPVSEKTNKDKLNMVPFIIKDILSSKDNATYGYVRIFRIDSNAIQFKVVFNTHRATFTEHEDLIHEIYLELLNRFTKEKISLGYVIKSIV